MHSTLHHRSFFLRRWANIFACFCFALVLIFTLFFFMQSPFPLQAAPAAFSCADVTEIPQDECAALVAFYNSADAATSITMTTWLQTNTPCIWRGIACSSETPRRVRILDLDHSGLSGLISPALGELSQLYYLDLTHNRLQGVIPPTLGKLINLGGLQLDNNQLKGSIPVTLTSNLTKLTLLTMSSNELSGPIPSDWPEPSQLVRFDLGGNRLDGSIPASLGSLSELTLLQLNRNELTGPIPPALGRLKKLFQLFLQDNHLSGQIPLTLGELISVTHVRLENNQLSGEIPQELITISDTLTDINLSFLVSNNMLTAKPDSPIRPMLAKFNPGWETVQTLPPTNLQMIATSGTAVTLTWTPTGDLSNNGYYEIGYTTTPGGPYQVVTTTNKLATTHTVTNLCPATNYAFTTSMHTLPHGGQRNHLSSLFGPELNITTAPRAVDLLLLPILATDSNLDEYYAEYVAGIQDATARDTRIMALVLADRSHPADAETRILKIQCGQVERLTGLPNLDLAPTALDATLREYDMTNPRQLAAFIRWARTTLGNETPAGDVQSIKTVVSYVGHGLPIAPATDISSLIKNPANALQPAALAVGLRGLPPAPTKIPATPDQLTDQTSLTLISPYALTQALVLATDNGAHPITVLDIVHCFGGTIEELYELSNPDGQPVAEMVVTSPNYTYAGGVTFTKALLGVRSASSARQLAETLVAAYTAALAEADGYDDNLASVEHPRIIVAVDLSKVAAVKQKIDELSVAILGDFAESRQPTKDRLLAAHSASIHYDTVPSAYAVNEDPTDSCPHDFRLTANDGLSDLTSFANQIGAKFESPSVRNAATSVIATANEAVLARSHMNGIPWFAHNATLEPWTFDGAGGIALYTDFQGITVGETTYIGWQAHWYTSTVSVDNPHPYQFVQGEHTWSNVVQSYWAAQLGSDGVKTMACVTLLPHLHLRQLYMPMIQK